MKRNTGRGYEQRPGTVITNYSGEWLVTQSGEIVLNHNKERRKTT